MSKLRRPAIVGFALFVAAVVLIAAGPACAQATPNPQAATSDIKRPYVKGQDGKIYHLGDTCVRKSDRKAGVVKSDACLRWYCSLPDAMDIIEVRPNLAQQLGCQWRVVNTKCRCVRPEKPK